MREGTGECLGERISLMPQVYQHPDIPKISKQGQRLFEALDPELREQHRGQFVAIEVDSGDYFIGETAMAANQKARAKHPGKVFFLIIPL